MSRLKREATAEAEATKMATGREIAADTRRRSSSSVGFFFFYSVQLLCPWANGQYLLDKRGVLNKQSEYSVDSIYINPSTIFIVTLSRQT